MQNDDMDLNATITVTEENDGTFYVRADGGTIELFGSRESAERCAAHVRQFNADFLAYRKIRERAERCASSVKQGE